MQFHSLKRRHYLTSLICFVPYNDIVSRFNDTVAIKCPNYFKIMSSKLRNAVFKARPLEWTFCWDRIKDWVSPHLHRGNVTCSAVALGLQSRSILLLIFFFFIFNCDEWLLMYVRWCRRSHGINVNRYISFHCI